MNGTENEVRSLPRRSGDYPYMESMESNPHTFTPQKRGLSRSGTPSSVGEELYPAEAGIIHHFQDSWPHQQSFTPQKRGLSSKDAGVLLDHRLCPAEAGIILPKLQRDCMVIYFTSQKRGLSLERLPQLFNVLLYPAEAGIIPSHILKRRCCLSLPRMSGDYFHPLQSFSLPPRNSNIFLS